MSAADRPWLDSYAVGVPRTIEEDQGTLVDLIETAVARFPRHVALEFFGATMTYAELGGRIRRVASALRRLGVGKGDRVALVMPNCPQHVVAFYAVLRLGAVVVEHNPLYTPRELRHQFEDHGARVAIVWDRIAPSITDLPADLGVDTVVAVDMTRAMRLRTRVALRLPIPRAVRSRRRLTGPAPGTIDFDRLASRRPLSRRHPRPTPDDLALIQYTSGTTGSPKGARLSHANLTVNAAQSRAWIPQIEPGSAVVYAVLPLFHAYGLTLCLTFAMSMGARLVLFPAFEPDLVLEVVKRRPATFLPAVPPIYARLLDASRARRIPLEGIGIGISGAMDLPVEMIERWERATGGMLVEGYGLSEASPVLMANPVSDGRRIGTVGLPFPETEVRVVDREDLTTELPFGQEGELVARGPQVFSGYWGRDDETEKAFADGWLRTGDIATMDADGFVTIVDRVKELIITGGFNVTPSEVEDALRGVQGVEKAAVVGAPNGEKGGEDVVAVVVMDEGAAFDGERIRDAVRGSLAAYKVPRRVLRADELPTSMIGKVLRREVRRRVVDGELEG